MTSRVVAEGNGAAGAVGYVTHDAPIDGKPQKTSARVAGVAVRGVPLGCRPELAARVMQSTITDAPWLKRRAGIPPGGRKLKYGIVHSVLSWPRDQHPTVEEMFAAGDSWLAANGFENHYTVMAIHREEGKPDHLHKVICRVDPETGRAHRGNLATGGSRWAEEYERSHGGIRIPTRVERNRLRAEIRRLRKDGRAAQAAGPTVMDRVQRLFGAPDTVEKIGNQIDELRSNMPAIEPTRSAGRHRQRAEDESRSTWNQLYTAQREEREALAEKGAPQHEVDQLVVEQRLARKELARRLKQGENVVSPRTRVPARPERTHVRPPPRRVLVAVATDPAEHAHTTRWFRENAPEPGYGRQLVAAGYTPRRLEEALGPELAPPWVQAMRQYIAGRERPKDLSTLFEPGANPLQRELKEEWFREHAPTEADAKAFVAAGYAPRRLREALGPESAPPWVEAVTQYLADAPPPGIRELFAALGDPSQRERATEGFREWFRLNEPTDARVRAVVATGIAPAVLQAVLKGPQAQVYTAERSAARELAGKWGYAVFRQYVAEIGAAGVNKREEGDWDRQFDEWETLVNRPSRTNDSPRIPTQPPACTADIPTASAPRSRPRRQRAAASPLRGSPRVAGVAAARRPRRSQVRKPAAARAPFAQPRSGAPKPPAMSTAAPRRMARVRGSTAAPPAPVQSAPAGPETTAAKRTRKAPAARTGRERPAAVEKGVINTPPPTSAAPAPGNVSPPSPAPARRAKQATATFAPEPTPAAAAAPQRRKPAGEPPTNEDLIEGLRTGNPAGPAWFWAHRPDRANCRKVVAKAMDPKLVARVLSPELAQDWVPELEETYAVLKKQQFPVWDRYRSHWEQKRPEWEPLPAPTAPTQPDSPLTELASKLQREVLPSAGKLLQAGDRYLEQLKAEIDKQDGEPAAREMGKELIDHLRKTSPYAPWQRENAELNHHMDTVNREIRAFNARPWRKRVLAKPPDPQGILKRIIPEAIAKLARAVVEFCRRALGLDRPHDEHAGAERHVEMPAPRPPALRTSPQRPPKLDRGTSGGRSDRS